VGYNSVVDITGLSSFV